MKNSNKIKAAVKFAIHSILGIIFLFEGMRGMFTNANIIISIGSSILGAILWDIAMSTTYKKEGK